MYLKYYLFVGLSSFISSCLPEGKPPRFNPKDDIDILTDAVNSNVEDIKSDTIIIPKTDNSISEYIVEVKPEITTTISDIVTNEKEIKTDLSIYDFGIIGQEVKLDTQIYDMMIELLEVKTLFDSSPLETILETTDLKEKLDTTKEVSPTLIPYQPDENCVVLYHFDPPNYFIDSCNGINLEYNIGTIETISQPGFGSARLFTGDTYLEPSNKFFQSNPELEIKTEITIEALVKPDLEINSYKGDFGNIIAKAEGLNGKLSGYILFIGDDYVGCTMGINDSPIGINATCDLPTDKFTSIACTYDGKTLKLYIDSVLSAEKSAIGEISYSIPKDLFIGWNYCCGNGFIGAIDEVRISNVAREF